MKNIIRNRFQTALILCLVFVASRSSAIVSLSHPVSAIAYTNAALGAILILDADLKEVANAGRGTNECFPVFQSLMGWVILAENKNPEYSFSKLSEQDGRLLGIDEANRNLYNDNLGELNRIFESVLLFAEEQENYSAETYMDAWNTYMGEIGNLGLSFETIAKIFKAKVEQK